MSRRSLKKISGRIKETKHLAIVEIRWVDAASTPGWMTEKAYCQTAMCTSVGYYDGIYNHDNQGDQVHIYGDKGLDNKTYARCHGIPMENIREFRIVSKGKE